MAIPDSIFRSILNSAPDALIVTDSAGTIALINTQAESLFGYSNEELIGQPVEVLVPERLRKQHAAHRTAYARSPRTRPMGLGLCLNARRKDGSEFPAEISLAPVHTGQDTLITVAVRDVTERRRNDAKFRGLLEAAPDAMVIVDTRGRILLVNAQTEQLFGYRREELLAQPVEMLVPQRYRAGHAEHRMQFFRAPRVRAMGSGLDLYGLRSDGTEFPVEISLSPLETEEGLLVSGAIRDISERKQVHRQLIEARNEADRANRAKSAFLAAASHDLRQPLQTLTLLNRVLERTVKDPTAAIAVKTQTEALESVSQLLDALLDISKLESGAVLPEITEVPVQALLRRLKGGFQLQAQAKGIVMVVSDCHETVRSDAGLLERMIQNLVANAIRYTRQGRVELRCIKQADLVRIEVLDTGIGIPEDQMEAIFDDFYQVHPEHGEKREGLGLGLSIVRRLSLLLNHPIEVRSEPGRGSCFSITVPCVAADGLQTRASRAAQAVPPARAARILLVDDQPAVARATRMLLELEGHQVSLASSLAEMRQIAQDPSNIPDVLICDYHLSRDTTGVDAAHALRAMTERAIPVILVTGDTSSAIALASRKLPHCHVLSKPVDADELLARIQQFLS